MKYRVYLTFFLLIFFLSGCSVSDTPLSLLSYKKTVSMDEVNTAVSKLFPLKRKSSFGSVVFKRVLLKPFNESNRIGLSVSFVLTSFEIPEGIEGVLTLSSGLRYDPQNKKIHLVDVLSAGARFGDTVLAQYVSRGARSALNAIAMREFSGMEIHQIKESFAVRFIKSISVRKGKIVIQYGA